MKKKTIKKIQINQIETKKTQTRIEVNEDTVFEYAEDMKKGDEFPPLIVFSNGKKNYLADGFHRLFALKKLKKRTASCEIRKGNLRDAILFAVGANAKHGLRRTNEDKRNSVTILLKDKKWKEWSNREIAKQCNVSHAFVNKLRGKITGNVSSEKVAFKNKHGTISKMNIKNLTKKEKKNTKSTGNVSSEIIVDFFPKTLVSKLQKYSKKNQLEEVDVMKKALKLFFETEAKKSSKRKN